MSFEHKAEVLRNYRGYAIWGGAFLGIIISLVAFGPHFRSWSSPFTTWSLIATGSGLVGALVGYLFFSIIVGSEAGRGPGRGIGSGSEGGISGVDGGFGGDGGGGGE